MNGVISVSVIVISLICAYTIVRKENIHCRQLENCILLVREIRNSATQFAESFSDIIESLDSSDKYQSLDFIKLFTSETKKGILPPDAWKNALGNSSCSLYQWERDVLVDYGNKMFSCSREEIEEISDFVITQLKDFSESATEKRNKTTKTGAVCTVSAGVMIGLLIL